MSRAASMLFTIDEIDAALDRIADGTYGRCARCGSAIPLERLEFRPSASGCVACQASTGLTVDCRVAAARHRPQSIHHPNGRSTGRTRVRRSRFRSSPSPAR